MTDKQMELIAAPLDTYSAEDQLFFRFWYGHMENDMMTGALANVDHATARYIWQAARRAQADKTDGGREARTCECDSPKYQCTKAHNCKQTAQADEEFAHYDELERGYAQDRK